MKILYRGIFIATFKRTYIQDQARPIFVTSLLSYETSPYFSWREKSLLPKILSQLEPWELNAHFYSAASLKYHALDTWHDTTPSHIILLAILGKFERQAKSS